MSAGLAASTETPGSTPPDASRTVPAMPLACCADAVPQSTMATSDTAIAEVILPMCLLNPTRLFLAFRCTCGAQHMLQSEVSFVARVFVDKSVDAVPRQRGGPRPRPRLWVRRGELVVDRPVARAREAFHQTHVLRRVLEGRP